MSEVYTVVDIFRVKSSGLEFLIAAKSDKLNFFLVHSSLSDKMSKGMVYINDRIKITNFTDDGIKFEVLDDAGEGIEYKSDVGFYYKDLYPIIMPTPKNKAIGIIPFLCDVMPYNNSMIREVKAEPIFKSEKFTGKYLVENIEVSNIKIPLPESFLCKIHQKTRITFPNSFNPFFFVIVSSNNISLKIIFWKEDLKEYSNLKVNDVIKVNDYKLKKKWSMSNNLDLNTFTESVYFNCEEITAKGLTKIKVDKSGPENSIFEKIEGRVTYISVLMRYKQNDTFMEYKLMTIGDQKLMLFYNSDFIFYDIKVDDYLKIREVRNIKRAGFQFYVSTIYTQFEINNEDSLETSQPGFSRDKLHDGNDINEAVKDTDIVIRGSSIPSNKGNDIVCFKIKHNSDNNSQEKTPNENCLHSEQVELVVSDGIKRAKVIQDSTTDALGFIPDNFSSIKEIFECNSKELVNDNEIRLNLFMKPQMILLSELCNQNIVLNESKKFIVLSTLLSVFESEYKIEYLENKILKEQKSLSLLLENNVVVYVFANFFDKFATRYEIKDFVQYLNQKLYFVIESFRCDADTLIMYLTGLIKDV